jgi:pimeloyl-ACP methyl ester carboxylesterase
VPIAAVNGQRIGYDDHGGSGPPVVFSHGFFMDRSMFDPQVADLSPDYRCITVDARGFGETEFDEQPFTYWDNADDLIGLLDHLEIPTATFVGMSQGGFTTMRVALAHPDRVTAIVLIDTDAAFYDDATQAAYRGGKESLVENGWTPEYAGMMASILFGPSFDTSGWVARWQTNPPARFAESFETMITRDDIGPRLGEITVPSLVLHGELDNSIPVSAAQHLVDSMPGSVGLVVVAGAGHSSNLENPAVTNDALRTFLAAHAH